MTSPNASMVSSGAARGSMDATHVCGTTQSPQMPKACGEGKPHRKYASAAATTRVVASDVAYRQSRSREYAGSAAADGTGTTQINLRQAVRVVG